MNLIISIITLSNNRQKATNQTSKEKAWLRKVRDLSDEL